MAQAPLVEVCDVTIRRDLTTILENISWKVSPGEHWIIFGPNGAGKTSLLNALLGYLWPTTGTITVFNGTLGDGVDVREMRSAIPVVSESLRRMIHDYLTGLEILVTGARAHLDIFSPASDEEQSKAESLAGKIGLTPLLNKPFGAMSTGEQQRMLLARALMANPKLVILDEPCAGLDLAGREWVLQMIDCIMQRPEPPSLLLTTHHVEEIPDGFTHALLLKQGKVFACGIINDSFNSENLSRQFELPLALTRSNGRWYARAVPEARPA